jgi:CBS domain containing-hemolysin-like protein
MRLVLYILLILILANAVVIDKALSVLSLKELKRRARAGHDKRATAIYKMATYERSLNSLLWLKGSAAAAILFVLLIGNSWLLALVFLAVLAWLVRGWQVHSSQSWVWSWAAFVAPLVAWLMAKLQPLLGSLMRRPSLPYLTKVYEKEDLIELLAAQQHQPDNRVPADELAMAANALTFGDKKVSDVMTPLRKMRVVSEDEEVGPLLMDELHSTGFSRFPVVATGSAQSNPKVIGTLFLRDIIGHESHSRVRDLMHKKVFFINETQNLRDGLTAFLKNHYHLFIVVNNFEEVVGVLSIEDVLEQIVGKLIVDEFDRYDDLRAVAGLEAKRESAAHAKVPVAPEPK